MIRQLLLTVLVIPLTLMSWMDSASAQTAREIMIKVDEVATDSYKSTMQKSKLSTFDYVVVKRRIKRKSKPTINVMENVQLNTGNNNKDSRSIAMMIAPPRQEGIGMLSYDYDDPERDTDTWLLLSRLGKVRRMISNVEDSDESGSFFGTEFSIEDMESNKIDDYTYRILQEGSYTKRPVWVIESIPTQKRKRKTRYSKSVSVIDKERYILLKADLYNRHGAKYKQLTMRNVQKIDNVWVARKVTMNNLLKKRITTMELLSVTYDLPVPDETLEEFLTKRAFTDSVFREKNLASFRQYLK